MRERDCNERREREIIQERERNTGRERTGERKRESSGEREREFRRERERESSGGQGAAAPFLQLTAWLSQAVASLTWPLARPGKVAGGSAGCHGRGRLGGGRRPPHRGVREGAAPPSLQQSHGLALPGRGLAGVRPRPGTAAAPLSLIHI